MSHHPQKSHQVDTGGVDVQFIALITGEGGAAAAFAHNRRLQTRWDMLNSPCKQLHFYNSSSTNHRSPPLFNAAPLIITTHKKGREEESKEGKPQRSL